MNGFPLKDAQFWIATLIALAAGGWVLRSLMPPGKRRAKPTKVSLTLGGRPIAKGGGTGSAEHAQSGSGGSVEG